MLEKLTSLGRRFNATDFLGFTTAFADIIQRILQPFIFKLEVEDDPPWLAELAYEEDAEGSHGFRK